MSVRRDNKPTQFIRFLAVGGVAAAVNFCSRIVLNTWLPFLFAILIAYVAGMITAFLLNRRYVFPDAANHMRHQILWFTIVNLIAVAQTLLISLALVNYFLPYFGIEWHAKEIAHAAGVVVPILSSFAGHKYFSFRES
jgi:putative flippase GtrA